MTFQPVLVGAGLVGWQFLKATQERQQKVFETSPAVQRDTDYFKAEIANIKTPEDLVADRRLLSVALGAFGLQDDIDNRFFIKTILEEGTTNRDALANRLTDERYKSLARAFAFDSPAGPRTQRSIFPEEIVSGYHRQAFQVAVGNTDETMRLALNFESGLSEVSESPVSDDAKWFRIMGTPPLRSVLETALGLPSGFGQLDIDKQLEVFKDKMEARFGVSEISQIAEPQVTEKVIRGFLLQTEVRSASSVGSGQVALSLLQAIPRVSLNDAYRV